MITRIMVDWKGERFWLGKRLEHPEVMTQGETVEELEENLKDAFRLLVLDDVPAEARVTPLEICSHRHRCVRRRACMAATRQVRLEARLDPETRRPVEPLEPPPAHRPSCEAQSPRPVRHGAPVSPSRGRASPWRPWSAARGTPGRRASHMIACPALLRRRPPGWRRSCTCAGRAIVCGIGPHRHRAVDRDAGRQATPRHPSRDVYGWRSRA